MLQSGVLYFGDDDNSYDLRLFEEIRDTRNISMFPVGLIGDYAVSAPVVHDVNNNETSFALVLPINYMDTTILFDRGKW